MNKKVLLMLLALTLVLSAFSGCQLLSGIDSDILLENTNARTAIALGFDKDFIIVDIMGDKGDIASDSYVPIGFAFGPAGTEYAGIDFRDCITEAPSYDLEVAKAAWAKAKEELDFKKATLVLLNYDSDVAGKISEHIKEELERNLEGLTIEIKSLPFAEKLELGQNGDFDINYAGWGPDYQNPLTFLDMWETNSEYNNPKWSNAEYDALIETARTSEDATEAWEAMMAAEEMISVEFPIAPLYQRGRITLINEDVTMMLKHGFGPDYTYKWTDMEADDNGKKVLNLLQNTDVPDLDINAMTDTLSLEMINNTNEGLLRLGEGDIPVLAGAQSMSYADGSYTFKLREDAVWVKNDGSVYGDVTAADYVYSWDRLQSEELAAQYSFLVGIAGIVSYEAVDNYTFVVEAKESLLFESLMTFPVFLPVNEAFVASVTSELFGKTAEGSLYNGPFYLAEWELTSHTSEIKNAEYWDAGAVKLDEIYTRYITGVENNTAVQMYLDGEINRVGLSGENVALYRDRDDAHVQGETTCFYLEFNVDNHGPEAE